MLGLGLSLTNRGGGPVVDAYAKFVAHITALATGGVKSWTAGANGGGAFRVTTAAKGGSLLGSCWLTYFYNGGGTASAFSRLVQHGLPSEAVLDAQIAAGREVYLNISSGSGSTEFTSVDRNGYASFGQVDQFYPTGYITDLIYWDGAQAQRMNPSTGTAPTPYVIP